MHSEQTWHLRRLRKEARGLCSEDRFVDFGVRIYTVVQDRDGVPIRVGGPKVCSIRDPIDRGGVFDVHTLRWVEESPNPIVWSVSEEQRRLILPDDDVALQVLCEGAEGGGKTTGILARWLILRSIERLGMGLEFGCVAPTQKRLERVRQALAEAMPPEWYGYRQRDWLFTFAGGSHRLRLVSAHQPSEAGGSPVQGYDWAGGGADETQDQIGIVEDIRARGRRAPEGRFPMMMTATIKSAPEYRSFRDKWQATQNCAIERIEGLSNPYVDPEFWEARRRELSEREYKRRVLALDVGPEKPTYPAWVRKENLRPIPQIGAEDITTEILAPWGPRLAMLIGHDPGKLFDVSIMFKAYRLPGRARHVWWVVDELTTELSTTEHHMDELVKRLRDRWNLQQLDWRGKASETSGRVLVRADPYSDSGNDEVRPDKSVYTIIRRAGLMVLPAATSASVSKVKVARVPKESGIEMLNSLCCTAAGERRLFVACNDKRQPVAPRLVVSLERSERDSDGKAETQKKNVKDLSHWPAASRYALWQLERPRMFREADEAGR